jgi:hypothetical protein
MTTYERSRSTVRVSVSLRRRTAVVLVGVALIGAVIVVRALGRGWNGE